MIVTMHPEIVIFQVERCSNLRHDEGVLSHRALMIESGIFPALTGTTEDFLKVECAAGRVIFSHGFEQIFQLVSVSVCHLETGAYFHDSSPGKTFFF